MPACELCERDVDRLTVHHLIPRSKGKKGQVLPTALTCSACHRQLHALFDHDTLAQQLNTVAALRDHPDMARFLKWVRRQPPSSGVRVRR